MPTPPENAVTNWAGNLRFRAARQHRPTSLEELQEIVAGADRVHALGTGHSFTAVADTTGDHVCVAGLPGGVDVDHAVGTATVTAGLRYGDAAHLLHGQGVALHNLGSLPHISVAGSVATGTHGSGDGLGSLATAVRAVEMVTSGGELVRFDRQRDADVWGGVVVALGALGVVTRIDLDVEPTYEVSQVVQEHVPVDELLRALDEVLAAAYSVSVFTDWREPVQSQVWLKSRVDDQPSLPPRDWLGGRRARRQVHMLAGRPPDSCTPQLGRPGPWHQRLPHFRLAFTPSSGEELQSEWFVPRQVGGDAVRAAAVVLRDLTAVVQTTEIRSVAADDLWLSPAYGRASLALHVTWVRDVAAVLPAVERVEAALAPFAPRPHWAKLSRMSPDTVAARYPRLDDFAGLARRLDPRGAFRNDLLDSYVAREPATRPAFTS